MSIPKSIILDFGIFQNRLDSILETPARAIWTAIARLWDFGRLLVGSSFESLRRRLEASNAFQDDETAILRF